MSKKEIDLSGIPDIKVQMLKAEAIFRSMNDEEYNKNLEYLVKMYHLLEGTRTLSVKIEFKNCLKCPYLAMSGEMNLTFYCCSNPNSKKKGYDAIVLEGSRTENYKGIPHWCPVLKDYLNE